MEKEKEAKAGVEKDTEEKEKHMEAKGERHEKGPFIKSTSWEVDINTTNNGPPSRHGRGSSGMPSSNGLSLRPT